jgi:hypothetical protein
MPPYDLPTSSTGCTGYGLQSTRILVLLGATQDLDSTTIFSSNERSASIQYTKDRRIGAPPRERTRIILSLRKQPPNMTRPLWDDPPELGQMTA